MQPHVLRLVAFLVLTGVFGVSVWASETTSSNELALLAQVTKPVEGVPNEKPAGIGTGGTPDIPLVNAGDKNNKECPKEDNYWGYNKARKYGAAYCAAPGATAPATPDSAVPAVKTPPVNANTGAAALAIGCRAPQKVKINAYDKPCTYKLPKNPDLQVKARCVAPEKCRAYSYIGQDKKEHQILEIDPATKLPPTSGFSGNTERVADLSGRLGAPQVGPSQPAPSTGNTRIDTGQIGKTPGGAGTGGGQPSTGGAPGGAVGGATPGTRPGTSPIGGIGAIADRPSQGGGSQGGSTNRQQQAFRASPILGNIANWAFGPSTGSGQGSGGGSSGATVAYAPQGDPGFYNRNFESAGAQITFPDAQPSPDQIIAYLAQNTKRQQGDKVTGEELTDRGVVNTVVLQAINNVVTPVGDFIRSIFSGEATAPPSGEEVSTAAREEKPPLERGRLVLTLSADDSLVPGDPTSIANLPRPQYEAFESIPESSRAWGQNAPRAGEDIEGIASEAPTYGWGEPASTDEQGSEVDSVAGAPEVSDVPFEPFFPRPVFETSAAEEIPSEPPRSLFSAMGKSFETIGDAVGGLFSNIGKTLFWWL